MMKRPIQTALAPFALGVLLAFAAACGSDGLTLPDQTEPAHIEVISGSNQAGSFGSLLAEPLVVRVTDSQNRPVVDRAVAFVLTSSNGDVAPDTAHTDADGRATVRWTLGTTGTLQRLEARVVGPAPLVASFVASASTGQAASVERVRGDAQVAVAGSELPDSLVIRTLDAAGNPVAGIPVAWSVTGGGSVSATATVTGRDGTSGVRRILGPTVGAQSTAASVQGATGSPITFTATANPGTAGTLRIEVQPAATAQSGAPLSRQPQVQLVDANGNPVAREGVAVSASIASGPSGATLLGSTASTNAQGLASFTNLAISGGSGTYTILFTSSNVVGVTSTAITMTAGSARALRIVTQPSASTTTSLPFPTQPVVELVDAAGNPVATSGVPVTVAIATGGGTLGGTLTVTTDANGDARFTDLSITGDAGGRTLIFASGGLTSVTSSSINVLSGPNASQSSISAPATVTAGTDGAVTVTVRDAAGNPLEGQQVTLAASGSGNTITPGSATTNASGVATFTFSSTVAETKSLTATVGSITLGPVQVEVIAGEASASGTTASVPDGKRFEWTDIVVQARDQFGNPVSVGGANVTGQIEDGPNQGAAVFVEDRDDGTYLLSYFPFEDGEDTIEIRLNGSQISGSPYISKVRK